MSLTSSYSIMQYSQTHRLVGERGLCACEIELLALHGVAQHAVLALEALESARGRRVLRQRREKVESRLQILGFFQQLLLLFLVIHTMGNIHSVCLQLYMQVGILSLV